MLTKENKFVGVVDWSEASIDYQELELSVNNICTYVNFENEEEMLQRELLRG